MGSQDITTPDELPLGTTRLGPLVAWEMRDGRPLIWHWCDRHLWRTPESIEEYLVPTWAPTGEYAHDILSTDPLHLEPSVYWPGCCGLHGFIRDGVWIGV
jgi:hypothetical protein